MGALGNTVLELPEEEERAAEEAMLEEHDSSVIYDFDELIDRSESNSIKWSEAKNAVPLGVADADFAAPPCIVDAVVKRAKHGIFGYCKPEAKLAGVVSRYYKHRHQFVFSDDSVVFVPNLITALNICVRAFVPEGNMLLTTSPIYHPFLWFPESIGRETVDVKLRYDHTTSKFALDIDAMEEKISTCPYVRSFVLCNPHNPTGHVFTRSELHMVNQFAERHDLVVISDEIHCDLVYSDCEKPHVPFASIAEDAAQRCITLNSPSKTYNVPALHCAYVVITNPFLRQSFEDSMKEVVMNSDVGLFGMVALEQAYTRGEPWRLQLMDYLLRNRDMVIDFIAERFASHHVRVVTKPDATYLMWIDATGLGLENTAEHFAQHGAFLGDGKMFGPAKPMEDGDEDGEYREFDGYLRLNFATPRKILQKGLDNMLLAYKAALGLHPDDAAAFTANGNHKVLGGWAYKKARGKKFLGLFSNPNSWRSRYFVLKNEKLVYYSTLRSAGSGKNPKGEVKLTSETRVRARGTIEGRHNIVQLSGPIPDDNVLVRKSSVPKVMRRPSRKESESSFGPNMQEVLTLSFQSPDQANLWADALRSAIAMA